MRRIRSLVPVIFALLSFGSVHQPRLLHNFVDAQGASWTGFVLPYVLAALLGFLWRAIIKLIIAGIVLGLALAFIWVSMGGCGQHESQVCALFKHDELQLIHQ